MSPDARRPVRLRDALAVAPITGCALSPDGRFAAANVLTWDALASTRRSVLWLGELDADRWRRVGHEDAVHHGATFAADGRLAALRTHGAVADLVIVDPERPDDPGLDVVGMPPMATSVAWFERPGRLACLGRDGAGTHRLWVWSDPGERPKVASPSGVPISGFDFAHGSQRVLLHVAPPRRMGDDDPDEVLLWAPDLRTRPRAVRTPEPLRGALAWSPDGRWIAGLGRPSGRALCQPRLWVVDPVTGEAHRLLEGQEGWITQLAWTHDSAAVVASVEVGLVGRLVRAGLDGAVRDLGPVDAYVNAACFDRDRGRMLHLAQDGHVPQHLRVRDPGAAESRRVGDFDAPMRALDLRPYEDVAWAAPDGTRIEGLLALPEARDPPLVVWLHGGPAEHLQRTFSAYFQVLIAQGFAVLAPNYRGSTGRDDAFLRASVGALGEVDVADVLAGVDAVAGRVDAARVAFVGWSYGATLALHCAASRPGTRAVVAGAPVVDWVTAHGARSWPWLTRAYFPADPWVDPAPYDRASPLRRVGTLDAPTLLLHGEADERVPSSHPRVLHRFLQARGVATDLRYFPGEGHVFTSPWAVQEMLARMVGWLRTHVTDAEG